MFHNAIAYQLFDKLTSNIKPHIKDKSFSVMGYSKIAVEKRLLQQFSLLELCPFKNKAAKYSKNNIQKTILDEDLIRLKRFRYNADTGDISVNFSYYIKSLLKFLVRWQLLLFLHIRAIFVKNRDNRRTTLVYGVSISEKLELEFINFCKYGPIVPLNNATCLMIEKAGRKSLYEKGRIEYSDNLLHALVLRNGMSISEFLVFFIQHFKSAVLYFKSIVNYPLMAILDDDFSYHALVSGLNNRYAIENILITNSNISIQPLWMADLYQKKYSLHMAWYSQNAPFSFVYKCDGVTSVEIRYRDIRVDETWTWTKYFSNHLKSLGTPGVFHDVGPILWYLPPKNIPIKNKDYINISVFDVTPVKRDVLDDIGYSDSYMYYSFENMSKFIQDIIYVAKVLEELSGKLVTVSLKHKRELLPHHDIRYMNLIKSFSEDTNDISIIHPDENLYSLVSNSDVVINYPYTSTAYIADYMNIPAIYYDPVQKLIPVYEESEGIMFSSGKDDLLSKLNNIFPSK
jgi:polysaccharide biosynthesis PFTS motif protein